VFRSKQGDGGLGGLQAALEHGVDECYEGPDFDGADVALVTARTRN
jgi:hypothetical protein